MNTIVSIFMSLMVASSHLTALEGTQLSSDLKPNAAHVVSEAEENIYQENKFETMYFSYLRTNFGRNTKGSCTYVALAQLLSFYDTYWDDSLIDENYDVPVLLEDDSISLKAESPGIYQEPVSVSSYSTQEYYGFIEQH